MTKKLYIIALLSVIAISVKAQMFGAPETDRSMLHSQIILQTSAYQGTVYEPFSNTTPSEQSEIGAQYAKNNAPAMRKSLIGGPEDKPGPSPIGDALWPLLLMAAIFCGVIALRRRRAALKR